jgi:hypothetical protein
MVKVPIAYCPICGARLRDDLNMLLESIPIKLRDVVWTYYTDCTRLCIKQYKKDRVLICDRDSPCHTEIHSIYPIVIAEENFSHISKYWKIRYFRTYDDAYQEAVRITNLHKAQLEMLGYII